MEDSRIEWLKANYATAERDVLNKMFPELDQKQLSKFAGELGLARDLSLMGRIATKEDDEWLKNNYKTASWQEIKERFVGLTPKQIGIRAKALGVKKMETEGWGDFSENDDKWLLDNYKTVPWYEVLIRFEDYGENQIIYKAKTLGLKRVYPDYSEEEKGLIKENYTKCKTIRELIIKYKLNRTESAILKTVQSFGIRKRLPWTQEEEHIILSNYHNMKRMELLKLLPGRNARQLNKKLLDMGLIGMGPGYQYTEDDYEFIRQNYMTMTDSEIGEALHREAQSIKELRRKLKLYRKNPDDPSVYKRFEDFLINEEKKWKRNSMEFDNTFLCFLSDEKFDNVHHLYSRNLLIKDTISELEIDIDDFDINKCSKEERDKIVSNYKKQEEKHPSGICLRRDIHLKFHNIYGYGNNTPEQFVEFVKKFFPDKLDKIKKHIQQNYNS